MKYLMNAFLEEQQPSVAQPIKVGPPAKISLGKLYLLFRKNKCIQKDIINLKEETLPKKCLQSCDHFFFLLIF